MSAELFPLVKFLKWIDEAPADDIRWCLESCFNENKLENISDEIIKNAFCCWIDEKDEPPFSNQAQSQCLLILKHLRSIFPFSQNDNGINPIIEFAKKESKSPWSQLSDLVVGHIAKGDFNEIEYLLTKNGFKKVLDGCFSIMGNPKSNKSFIIMPGLGGSLSLVKSIVDDKFFALYKSNYKYIHYFSPSFTNYLSNERDLINVKDYVNNLSELIDYTCTFDIVGYSFGTRMIVALRSALNNQIKWGKFVFIEPMTFIHGSSAVYAAMSTPNPFSTAIKWGLESFPFLFYLQNTKLKSVKLNSGLFRYMFWGEDYWNTPDLLLICSKQDPGSQYLPTNRFVQKYMPKINIIWNDGSHGTFKTAPYELHKHFLCELLS